MANLGLAGIASGVDTNALVDQLMALERLYDVPVELAVEIGRAQMTTRETPAPGPGSIVTLNRLAGEPVDLLVNGKPIARGEAVVIDEEFGRRVTAVVAHTPPVAPSDADPPESRQA